MVEVTLTSGANVCLMNSSDFSSYKNGRPHRCIGGLATRSRVRFQIPSSGHTRGTTFFDTTPRS
ncbi:DUF1883 domain-containing protein [Nitrosomonas sp. Nm58]|uniref:DUF1883 domain-containing protein n=1 Tax=Nitrosomonas sp. Nm58 TaxID=200126 RepID=UPI003526E833